MTTIAKCLLEAKYAEAAQTTQVTAAAGTRVIVDKMTAYNVSPGPATLAINIVASAGSAAATNLLTLKSLGSGEAYTFPEIVGQVLNPGDFISTLAGTASAIVLRISGRETN